MEGVVVVMVNDRELDAAIADSAAELADEPDRDIAAAKHDDTSG